VSENRPPSSRVPVKKLRFGAVFKTKAVPDKRCKSTFYIDQLNSVITILSKINALYSKQPTTQHTSPDLIIKSNTPNNSTTRSTEHVDITPPKNTTSKITKISHTSSYILDRNKPINKPTELELLPESSFTDSNNHDSVTPLITLADSAGTENKLKKLPPDGYETTPTNITTINNVNTEQCGKKYFANAEILGCSLEMLVDSGSQANVIPLSCCPPGIAEKLAPASNCLRAYDGSDIDVLGIFETDIKIGQIELSKTPIFVVRKNLKAILGTPALSQLPSLNLKAGTLAKDGLTEHLHCDSIGEITTNNLNIQLLPKSLSDNQYMSYSNIDVTIDEHCELILPVYIPTESCPSGLLATDDRSEDLPGIIQIAKSVSHLTPGKPNCNIRVCNMSDKPVTIARHTPVVSMVEVCQIEPPKSNAKLEEVLHEIQIGSLDPAIKTQVKELVTEYIDVFAGKNTSLTSTNAVVFDIDTGSSSPVAQQKYRTPYFLRNELKRIIDKNVADGLMTPISSPWAAPVLLVRKSSGAWRLVCDYRKLNTVTISDQYPLPQISDLVNELADARVFSCMDLYSGFHQIPATKNAQTKMAVTTEFGQYSWTRMPMGAKNCPAVFQRLMDKCFRSMPASCLCIYIDDLLLHTKSIRDHLPKLREVFDVLRENKLQIRASKTLFVTNEVKFCGYKIGHGRKYPNPDKVSAVRNLKIPTSKKAAQQLFGLLNFHRGFIKNFAKIAHPIIKTYSSKYHFRWSTEAESALNTLKSEICDAALKLEIPNTQTAKYVVETDASETGYGATLFICTNNDNNKKAGDNVDSEKSDDDAQDIEQTGEETNVYLKSPQMQHIKPNTSHKHNSKCLRPIEYMSAQFNPGQRKYYIQEKELLAGKEAMRKWSHYLLGRHFHWQTDNACFKWARRVRSSKPRISQWLAEMSELDFEPILKPSAQMRVTDCLSRQFVEINALAISRSELANLQDADTVLQLVRNYHTNNRWPNDGSDQVKYYKRIRSKLRFGPNGEIMVEDNNVHKSIIPASIKREVMTTYHDSNGHPGAISTLEQLRRRYVWYEMNDDVHNYVDTCSQCQKNKPNLKPKKPPLGSSFTPTMPFEMIAWDLIGPLPISNKDNKYCLTGIDLFSKRLYASAIRSKEAFVVCPQIQAFLYQNPKLPKILLTDNGLEFADMTQFCQQNGIQYNHSAPYHPQANGCVERANGTLKNRLFMEGDESDWDSRLNRTVHAINSTNSAVTKYSPFAIETGYAGENPSDQIPRVEMERMDSREIMKNVYENITTEKSRRVERFANDDFVPFAVGDMVLAKNKTQKRPRYQGPYEVISQRRHGLSYELKNISTRQVSIRQVTDLKPFKNRPEPMQIPSDSHSSDSDVNLNFQEQSDSIGLQGKPRENPNPQPNRCRYSLRSRETTAYFTDNSDDSDFGILDFQNQPQSERSSSISQTTADSTTAEEHSPATDLASGAVRDINSEKLTTVLETTVYESANESTASDDLALRTNPLLADAQTQIEPDSLEDLNISTTTDVSPGASSFETTQILDSRQESDSRQSSTTPPLPSEFLQTKLYELTNRGVEQIAKQYGMIIEGSLNEKKHLIDKYFKRHFPTHPRTDQGHLMFDATFEPVQTRALGELTLWELKSIIRTRRMPLPKKMDKKSLQKHIKKQMLILAPFTPLVGGEPVFRAKSPTQNGPDESSRSELAHSSTSLCSVSHI